MNENDWITHEPTIPTHLRRFDFPGTLLAIATLIVVFARAAVRSLRVVGATLLGSAFLVTVAGSLANAAVLDAAVDLQGDPASFTLEFGPSIMVATAGLVCAALSDQIGVTIVNLSILKNQRAKAVRFSTLTAICHALECQPGDLFVLGE